MDTSIDVKWFGIPSKTIFLTCAIKLWRRFVEAVKGGIGTIIRHGKSAAAPVSVEASEIAHQTVERKHSRLVDYLQTLPEGDFERDRTPSRNFSFETPKP
jgi:hypothetical protein